MKDRVVDRQQNGAKKKVSLCMIVLDEAETLERAIESVLPVVDEIVIGIDDRTSDGSEEIAKRFTDKVYRFTWRDDFAAARNEMLCHCTGDWVLVLDGHEVLRESCLPLFQKMVDALPEETEAVGFKLKMQAEDNNVSGLQLRLFRNNGRLRYKGQVHNVVECDPQRTVGYADIVIDHLRPLHNRKSREKQRNVLVPRKMEEALAENPRDAKALYYLAMHAQERKDYTKAIEYYGRYLECSDHSEERYKVLWHLGRALHQNGDQEAAKETFFRGLRERWDLPECYVALGDMALQEGVETASSRFQAKRQDAASTAASTARKEKWDEAGHYFKMACDRKQPVSGVFFSEDFYSWLPYHKLCEVYDKAGRYYEALLAGEKLLTFENLPKKLRQEVESFMPRWADRVISSHPVRCCENDRQNLVIVDKAGHFTGELAEHLRGTFNVEVIVSVRPIHLPRDGDLGDTPRQVESW